MDMEHVIEILTYEFLGAGKHKLPIEKLLEMENAVFLGMRSLPEVESVQLRLKHQIEVLHIPTDEIPNRINEIPHDKTVGIFCSAVPDRLSFMHIFAPENTKTYALC